MPAAAATMMNTSNGRNTMFTPGTYSYHNMSAASTVIATQKSTSLAKTPDIGIITRGKYTFVISCTWLTKLLADSSSAFWKYVQGTSAVILKRAYGAPSDGIPANRPKTTVKISIEKTG